MIKFNGIFVLGLTIGIGVGLILTATHPILWSAGVGCLSTAVAWIILCLFMAMT